MLSIPTTAAEPKKTVSPRHALLEDLILIVSQHVNEQLLPLAARLSAAMLDTEDMSDAKLVYLRFKAGNLLKNNNYAFLNLASAKVARAVRLELAKLAPAPKAKAPGALAPMTLVPYEAMDEQVAVGALSRPFEVMYNDPLATLNVRLGYLLDRDILRLAQNPFRPEVFLIALLDTWYEFEADADAHPLLPPLLRPDLFLDFGPMLEALNLALMRKGVLPGSVDAYKGRRADSHDAKAKAPKVPELSPAVLAQQLRHFFSATDVVAPVVPAVSQPLAMPMGDFDLTIPHLPGGAPAGAPAGAGWQSAPAGPGWQQAPAPVLTQAEAQQPLLSYLARLQQVAPAHDRAVHVGAASHATVPDQAGTGHAIAAHAGGAHAGTPQAAPAVYLPAIKENAPKGSLTRSDESTIDLLSAIFETVFQDENISQEIRDLIRFLQIPVLKAALVDKEFFFEETHPARRLIDVLSRTGWEQRKGPDDPLFQAMQRSVERVGRDSGQGLSVFSEAVEELEASIQVEEQAAAGAIAAPIALALRQEKVAHATREAKQAVALRVGSGEVLAVVETFLENKWVAVMTIAYGVEEEKAGAVNNATTTMDDLIWSVKPKLSADERRQMIGKLPVLLSNLNKWLDIIKWQDGERLQFFAELADCHASIVRAPLELSPERQVEISLEVAQQAAQRRLELQNQVVPEPERVVDDAVLAVHTLQRGMWLAFALADGASRRVKLAWISPLRTLFIFSTSSRQEAFSMSGEALELRFRNGHVEPIRTDDMVGRALTQAMAAANESGAEA
ncbi:hypothetical protein AAKU55_002189 [Oxalobacteraceae bacterium GrIS 1.11]